MSADSQNPVDRLDGATAQRIAKLRSMPVETARLDAMLESQIRWPARGPVNAFFRLRIVRALAASIAVAAMVGLIALSLSGGAVLASPDMIARFHEQMLSGQGNVVRVDSIAEANKVLAAQADHSVQIPQLPTEHVMMCCMHSIKDKRVACVLLKSEGDVPITLAVAKAMDMRVPSDAQVRIQGGFRYHIQKSGRLQMVMTERDGRWICLIAELDAQRLIDLAGSIQF